MILENYRRIWNLLIQLIIITFERVHLTSSKLCSFCSILYHGSPEFQSLVYISNTYKRSYFDIVFDHILKNLRKIFRNPICQKCYYNSEVENEQNWTSGYVEIWTLLFVEFYLLVNELSDNLVLPLFL